MKRPLSLFLLTCAALIALLLARAFTVYDASEAPPLALDARGDINRSGAVARLSAAISIPTVSYDDRSDFDAEAFRSFRDLLRRSYPAVHEQAIRHRVNEHSLVFELPGRDAALEPVLFMGHYDVVPIEAASADQWRFDPFGGVLSENQLWGRGAVDDKLGVIGLMEALESLLQGGWRPDRGVFLAFGHDEEVGGQDGARRVADWFAGRGTRFALVLDEGGAVTEGIIDGVDAPVAVIGVAEKGWVNLRLTVRSAGGHSSQPPPHTAVGILARAIVRIENDPFPATLAYSRMTIDALGTALPFSTRFLFANDWLFEPLIASEMLKDPGSAASMRTTTAATMIRGSPKSNILPTEARAVVNARIIPGETARSVLRRVRQTVDDDRVEVEPGTYWDPSPVAPVDSPAFRLIAGAIRAVDPDILVAPYLVRGGTDARYFYGLSDHVYRFLMTRVDPVTTQQVHGINERVAVDHYIEAIRFYHLMLRAAGAARWPVAPDQPSR